MELEGSKREKEDNTNNQEHIYTYQSFVKKRCSRTKELLILNSGSARNQNKNWILWRRETMFQTIVSRGSREASRRIVGWCTASTSAPWPFDRCPGYSSHGSPSPACSSWRTRSFFSPQWNEKVGCVLCWVGSLLLLADKPLCVLIYRRRKEMDLSLSLPQCLREDYVLLLSCQRLH